MQSSPQLVSVIVYTKFFTNFWHLHTFFTVVFFFILMLWELLNPDICAMNMFALKLAIVKNIHNGYFENQKPVKVTEIGKNNNPSFLSRVCRISEWWKICVNSLGNLEILYWLILDFGHTLYVVLDLVLRQLKTPSFKLTVKVLANSRL